jgi:hypothetical protein
MVSSLSSLRCRLSSDQCHHAVASCHASFPWNQDELTVSASSFNNASSHCLPLAPKSKYWIRTTAVGHPSQTIRLSPSTAIKRPSQYLVTLLTTQSRLCFVSSLVRAPHHQSSTHCRYSLLPPYHTHHPSTQWHPRWWTSRFFFVFWIIYWYVNLHKKIF